MEPIDNWIDDQSCQTFGTDMTKFWGDPLYGVYVPWCALALPCRGVRHIYHVYGFHFGGELLLNPGIRLVSLFAVTGWPLPLVFGIKLVGLFEDPAASVGVCSWFIGGAMNLAGPIQYLVEIGWSISIFLGWLFPLTGFGAAESGVDRYVLRYFIIITMLVFIALWLTVAVSDFGSARIASAVAPTSEPTVFSHAKAGH